MAYKVIYDNFPDVYKFREAIQKRPTVRSRNHAKDNSESFAGIPLEEAYERLTSGIPDVVERLSKDCKKFSVRSATAIPQRRPINYYNGHAPNVPAAIIGLPKSMRKVVKTPSKVKTITLFWDACVPCRIKVADLEKAGSNVYQLVYWLERNGYRIRLYGVPVCTMSNGDKNEIGVCTVLLKDFRQPLDLLKMSFSLVSVSMWRRLGFRWIETVPGLKSNWNGYGYNMSKEKRMDSLKLAGFELKNAYYINFFDCAAVKFDPIELAKSLGIEV